jgi:two-component system response regulator TctD
MRLLLLEDNQDLANWLARLLRAENYVVDCVPDGETAVSGVSLGSYDLALVDLALPGMSGLEVIRAARARGLSIPILILTARNELRSRVEGLNAGADDYLAKPARPRRWPLHSPVLAPMANFARSCCRVKPAGCREPTTAWDQP